jgi:hypothetical protein
MLVASLLVASVIGAARGAPVHAPALRVVHDRPAPSIEMMLEMRDYMRGHAGSPGAPSSSIPASALAVALHNLADRNAMPLFARRYNVACSFCHTTIPRLNGTGYKFRAAGFRMPEDIGKESTKKFELGDFFSARIQARFDVQATNQPNGAAVANLEAGAPGKRTTTIAPSFQEATIYPLTGSFGKYFGALSELSVSPEDFFEVENAYLRFVVGTENTFFTSRVGVFHPWEGIGASDRPASNARTLFQTSGLSAGGRGVPYVYQPWGLDEVGAEVGGEFDQLSVRAAILGGTFMRWEEEANAFIAFPSQTGPWKGANQAVPGLGKPFDYVSHNTPDFSANVTYTLHEDGGGVSLLYYHGNIATPTRCTDGTQIGKADAAGEVCGVTASTAAAPFGEAGNTDFDFTDATAFRNNFDRIGVYAAYPVGKHFLPAVGYNYGRDHNADGTTFNSNGAFVEGSYSITKYATAGARYDWFHPNTSVSNKQWAFTPYLNIPLQNGFQIITEYQRRDFELAPGTYHRHNDTFQLRMIYIQ